MTYIKTLLNLKFDRSSNTKRPENTYEMAKIQKNRLLGGLKVTLMRIFLRSH